MIHTVTIKNHKIMEKKQDAPAKEKFHGTGNGTSLRTRTGTWFECKVKYDKVHEDGTEKPTLEAYTVDALSFTEAEARILDEMSVYVSGEFRIINIDPAKYGEIFFSDIDDDDLWFKAKLAFVTIDEKTQKEKRSYNNFLVQAKSLERARRYVDTVMGNTMIDYEIKSLIETKIMDVFEHHSKDAKDSSDADDGKE